MPFNDVPGNNALRQYLGSAEDPMNALARFGSQHLMPGEVTREEIIAARNAHRKRPEVFLGGFLDEASRISRQLDARLEPATPLLWNEMDDIAPRPLLRRLPDMRFSPNVEDRRHEYGR